MKENIEITVIKELLKSMFFVSDIELHLINNKKEKVKINKAIPCYDKIIYQFKFFKDRKLSNKEKELIKAFNNLLCLRKETFLDTNNIITGNKIYNTDSFLIKIITEVLNENKYYLDIKFKNIITNVPYAVINSLTFSSIKALSHPPMKNIEEILNGIDISEISNYIYKIVNDYINIE